MRFPVILLSGTCLALLASGCHHTYVMPETGTKFTYDMVDADSKGNYYLKLDENCKEVVYQGFTITREKDSPLKVYAKLNSRQNADWRVDPADFHNCQLACQVTRTPIPASGLPRQFTSESLKPFCRGRYGLFKDGTMLNISDVKFCGKPAIEYVARVAPLNVPATLIHGFMVYAEDEPGVIIDVLYFQQDGGRDTLKLRDIGERFLHQVRLTEEK